MKRQEKSTSNVQQETKSKNTALFSNINFVASQGPLPNTCVHHLQMIYDNKVDLVIMLTKLTERSKRGRFNTNTCTQNMLA